jgi:hypothetical protein
MSNTTKVGFCGAVSTMSITALLFFGLASPVVTGCDSCDFEEACVNNNNALVVGNIKKRCDSDPEGTGSTRTWRADEGTCTCDLSSENAQFFLRNCKFTPS